MVFLISWTFDITITILDVIHCPVYYLKHGISETGFCVCLQVELTEVDLVDRASLYLQMGQKQRIAVSVAPILVGSTWSWRQNPVLEMSGFK
jgi:hypothetical protein